MNNSSPLVYIIILTFNGKAHLDRCIPAVLRTLYSNFRVLLVDNGSRDDLASHFKSLYPSIEVVRNTRNLGFATGNNYAMQVALNNGAQYVVLLNDDAIPLDLRWIDESIQLMECDTRIGVGGFRIVQGNMEQVATPLQVSASVAKRIDGCAMVIRRSLLEQIGMFDDVYFVYAEEDDLTIRAVKAGYVLKVLNIPIYHLGGGTSKRYQLRASYFQIRNALRIAIKHRGPSRTLLRLARIVDIVCNPWPLSIDWQDVAHIRMRGNAHIPVNIAVLFAAVMWNIIFLPQTIMSKLRDDRRIQRAKQLAK